MSAPAACGRRRAWDVDMDESDPNQSAARVKLGPDHPAIQRIVRIVESAGPAPTPEQVLEELNLSGPAQHSLREGASQPLSPVASSDPGVDTRRGGVDPPPPRELGYDEKKLNQKFALVVMGG